MRETSKIHEGELILINSSYHYIFPEQAPTFKPTYGNRPIVGKSPTSGRDIYPYYTQTAQNCAQFDAVMLEAFNKMTSDFYSATGNYDLYIHDEDGYRTYDEQASKNSAKPSYYAPAGQSEHHTGMCTDLYYQVTSNDPVKSIDDPDVKDIYQWIYDNAYKYGFILRYPEDKANVTGVTYEPYHFRYVGYAHAYYMEQNDLCLEEYLDLLAANHTKDKALYFEGDNGNYYMVYYVLSSGEYTNVPVAEESANVVCTVSGDNKSGFIVTVEKKDGE